MAALGQPRFTSLAAKVGDMLRASVDAGAGGSVVNTVTGTANQVTASPTSGAVVVGLAAAAQALLVGAAQAGGATIKWAYCTISGTTITIVQGSGITSFTYNSTGNYTANFTTNFTNATFVALGSIGNGATAKLFNPGTQAIGSCVIFFATVVPTAADPASFAVAFIGV